ncbi:TetR/AcrR family transcriptional regulator [Alicyclobacillus sp. SO9]|uniref:TetR/AcrR family transcriptional regulator n=1 Tax=Alicyclobacillus sp. SO9 TaxID=2665646 RepID=UPI0018E8C328|nr:TetR/AcrR family transcriptional regulator [Alicyclobacillus sp. SO9]QQE80403.1 TetR/AcrR family transcriptional regulator [Alicyclobacillus sp. SO9]
MSTRDKVIQAATKLYAENGYKGMTMKAIANEVGVKAPSLYAFYESKEDILLHIYNDILTKHLNLATENIEITGESVQYQLKQFLDQVIAFQLRDYTQLKVFIRLLLFPPDFFEINLKEELKKVVEQEHKLLCNLFKVGMERGELKKADCDALSSQLLCMMDGWFWEMQRYSEEVFRERYEMVWAQFWNSIEA